jgi:hypothetical protein
MQIPEFEIVRAMRHDWRLAVPAISIALSLWSCGDPGFAFFARNDSPTSYLVRLEGSIKEAPGAGVILVVIEVPPRTSGEGYLQAGTWAGSVQLLSADCTTLEAFDPPVGGGVVWIRADGEASLVSFDSAFPDRASSPGPRLPILASVNSCGGQGGNGLLNEPGSEP